MTSWTKREPVQNLVILGDDPENKKKASGLLAALVQDRMYPDKTNYELVQKSGDSVLLSGSASLARQIGPGDVGKFIKCEFTGWGKSPNGKFKAIDVFVWDAEPTAEMKAWPRWSELQAKANSGNGAKGSAPAKQPAPATAPLEEFEDFPDDADNDDLPF